MLHLMNATAEADDIRQRWNELVALSSESRPPRYDCSYPAELLEKLCKLSFQVCQDIGLKAWNAPEQDPAGVVRHLQRAWEEFRLRPESFAGYELRVLKYELILV